MRQCKICATRLAVHSNLSPILIKCTLCWPPHKRAEPPNRKHLYEEDGQNLVVELSAIGGGAKVAGSMEPTTKRRQDDDDNQKRWPRQAAPAGCEPRQRLLAASKRTELCFAFHIGEHLQRLINGTDRAAWPGELRPSERLVEAELHLFKLLPQLAGLDSNRSSAPKMIDETDHDDDNDDGHQRQVSLIGRGQNHRQLMILT